MPDPKKRPFKTHSLQVQIVTIFLLLIAVSSCLIISFTYIKNYSAILRFSKTTIGRESSLIEERLEHVFEDAEDTVKTTAGFFSNRDVLLPREELAWFLFNLNHFQPNVETVYFGFPDGSFIGVVDLRLEGQTFYLEDRTRPLPKEALYAVRSIDRSTSPPTDEWIYKNESYETVDTESVSTEYDARTRPWYLGAVDTKKLFWTDIYLYLPLNDPGITVAQPIFDAQGQIVAVAGIDLSLSFLAPFLQEQAIGKSGRALILKETGEIIIPPHSSPDPAVAKAFSIFQTSGANDLIFKSGGIKYLASINPFLITTTNHWLICVIAPLSDFFSELIKEQLQVIVISAAILLLAALCVVYFSKKISKPIVILSNETKKIEHLELESENRVHSNILEITMMDSAIASMRRALRSFGRYIPKDVVRELLEAGKDISLGGEKKELTILFSDIAGFSAIAESSSPEELLPHLFEYFDGLSKIILETQGTIDKYMGDGIMAFWGAPLENRDHAVQSCAAALQCKGFLASFNERLKREGKLPFATRFGISSGMVIVGNVGTQERINYTVLGDTVNVASRLQSENKTYHTEIVINEATYQKVKDQFLTRPLDDVELRGMKKKTKIYELMAPSNGPEELVELSKMFGEAFAAFHSGDRGKAKELFTALHKRFPNDFPTKMYLGRD